jgi:preprotein translocase subunit SecB
MSDQGQAAMPPERQFMLQRIYIKDLSFETPNSPAIFRQEWHPETGLNLNTQVNQLEASTFEVVLTLTLTAKIEDKTAYLVEIQQAGIFTILGFPEEEMPMLLGAYCPATLFPYAREAISDLITKGSFPQMLLQPVNFDALFFQHQQQMMMRQAEAGGQDPAAVQ